MLILMFTSTTVNNFTKKTFFSFSSGIHSFPSYVSNKYDNFVQRFVDNDVLREKVAKLEHLLQKQKLRYVESEILSKENDILKKMNGLRNKYDFEIVASKIIWREPLTWFRQFTINNGRKSGIKVGHAVLFNGFLVGRVSAVYETKSQVITIADEECSISCRIKNDHKLNGILKGAGGGSYLEPPNCNLEYIFRDAELTSGMVVETSGYSTMIPSGITIGILSPTEESSKIGEKVNNVYQKAKVFPSADFDELSIVSVIIPPEVD